MLSKPLHIFTPAWGQKHISLMSHALGRSFHWKKNYAEVERAKWHLVSTPEDAPAVLALAKEILPDATVDILVDPRLTQHSNPGFALALAVMKAMDACLADGSPMLMATPDFVYGNGTIRAMMDIADRPGVCAGMAHIRVKPSYLNAIDNSISPVPSNAQLMHMAFAHAHDTWRDVQCGADPTMSYHCGVTWKWIGCGLAAVQHHMPSPFLVNFLPKDAELWQNKSDPGFGFWDHDWPTFLLRDERMRWIGSSDAAFMAEVTDPLANLAKLLPRNPIDPDAFFKDAYHCKIQRQFVTIFRGEV